MTLASPSAASLARAFPVPAALRRAERMPPFVTEPDSPFEDGYSIAGERAALAALLAQPDPDETHPLYPRLLLLEDREATLARLTSEHKARLGAAPGVSVADARAMHTFGALIGEEEDTMTLHTKDAHRVFIGRSRDPGGSYAAIPGGVDVYRALNSLFLLTANDNPYADWALLLYEASSKEITQRIDEAVRAGMVKIEASKARGLSFSILKSREPVTVGLRFRSGYGYAVAEMIVQFDYFIRVIKTLERKSIYTTDDARARIRSLTSFIRGKFQELIRFERWLMRPELFSLSRVDFLPGVTGDSAKRAVAAFEIFGPVPADIFSGRITPRHTRRVRLPDAQEQALLDRAGADLQLHAPSLPGQADPAANAPPADGPAAEAVASAPRRERRATASTAPDTTHAGAAGASNLPSAGASVMDASADAGAEHDAADAETCGNVEGLL